MKGPKHRNPIAKAVTRIRPQVIPDKRADLIEAQRIYEQGVEIELTINKEKKSEHD